MNSSIVIPIVLAGIVVFLSLVAVILWLRFGSGPKRSREFRRGQRLLQEGNWQQALDIFRNLQEGERLPASWENQLRTAMSAGYQAAGKEHLQHKSYEKALDALERSAELSQQDVSAVRGRVVALMLEEIRRLFSQTEKSLTQQVHDLIARTLAIKSPCREASFWQALCFLRLGQTEQAILLLKEIIQNTSEKKIDPYLYLGALLLAAGEAREALRLLSEANRIDSNCPMVICQLGRAMLASGGDAMIAIRALQRALGERGFEMWRKAPQLVWIEGFPEGKSYVRQLASKHTFICPLWGKDYTTAQRQGQIALGEGYFKIGQFEQAAEVFEKLSHASAPSHEVLRGLGLALVRLGRYDQAFKHLQAAHELEQPKTHITAGHLALCGAKGKPATPEDKIHNVNWALWLVRGFSAPGDKEYAELLNEIFAEARACGAAIEREDQVHLCDHLLSVDATDTLTADAIHHLHVTHPDALRPQYAWLYCRAAQLHDLHHESGTDLFARVFREPAEARRFFASRDWDFDELEFSFLERAAASHPGQFPAILGPEYPRHGEQLLLDRAEHLLQEKKNAAARAAAEVLIQLSPGHARAYDFLARLHYQAGDLEKAIAQLRQWHEHDASAWLPLTRAAVIYHEKGESEPAADNIAQALTLTAGRQRAAVAFLGARLKLAQALRKTNGDNDDKTTLKEAADLLRQCLQDDPAHVQSRWCLAAVSWLLGDQPSLVQLTDSSQPAAWQRADEFLVAAVGRLESGDESGLQSACEQAAGDPKWASEIAYLQGWAAVERGDAQQAAAHFRRTADGPKSPSQDHARALLGGLDFYLGDYSATIRHWSKLPDHAQTRWGLSEPLAQTIYLSALQDFHAGQYAPASEKLREAGKRGLREPRLGPLLHAALLRAGQQKLYTEEAISFLEQAGRVGKATPEISYLLAMCYKRLEKFDAARAALRKFTPPDANVLLQFGILSFREGMYEQAEQAFVHALEKDPQSYAATYNLVLCRFSLAKFDACIDVVPKLISLAKTVEEKRFLSLLHALICSAAPDDEPLPVVDWDWEDNGDGSEPIHRVATSAATLEQTLASMTVNEEKALVSLLQGFPKPETAIPLFEKLVQVRPRSPHLQQAYVERVLVQAKDYADRYMWQQADQLLSPMSRWLESGPRTNASLSTSVMTAFWNLSGCCACMMQDFDRAIRSFTAAIKWTGNDPWLYQNLALACELRGRLDQAELHWNRYFDLLDHRLPVPAISNYLDELAFAGLNRLADFYNRLERWHNALNYVQRAYQLRPRDLETLERLFNLYVQVRRPEDARRTLRRMREIQPGDPQFDLYELDLREVRSLEDLEHMLADIKQILNKYPGDMRVEDRAVVMVANCIPMIGRRCDQLSEQLAHIVEQVRQLPNYKIDWRVVHDEMHFLRHEFQKLRRISNKCLALVASEEHRRIIKDLNAHIDSKIDICISMGG